MSAGSHKPASRGIVVFARWTGALLALCLFVIAAAFAIWLYLHDLGQQQVERELREYRPVAVRDMGSVNSLRILPVVNWHGNSDDLRTEVGVSYLVEADATKILFDLGHNARDESPSPLEHNLEVLGIEIADIDVLFLSHAHFDHLGGRRWSQAKSFSFGRRQKPLPDLLVYTPIPLSYPGLTPVQTSQPQALLPGIATTGTIPRRLMIGRIDEQALVVNLRGRGLVLIVGCGHQTLKELLSRVERTFRERIYAVVGDLHYPIPTGRMNLLGINGQRLFASGSGILAPLQWTDVERDLDLLKAREPAIVALGGHDSSDEVIARFAREFGERYRHVRVGEWIIIN